jgi:hypothetical protein
MKDRYVKLEDGKVKLTSIGHIEENNKIILTLEGRVASINEKIDSAEDGSEDQLGLIAERVRLETRLAGYYDLRDYYETFGIISVKDSDFGSSGSASWWIIEGDAVRKPNTAELDAREASEKEAQQLKDIDNLYANAVRYQLSQVDDNTKAELDKSEALWESGGATVTDLPKAKENADFIESTLWGYPDDPASEDGTYFARKNHIIAGNQASLDFSNLGEASWGFVDIRTERKTFLATQ